MTTESRKSVVTVPIKMNQHILRHPYKHTHTHQEAAAAAAADEVGG